MSDFRGIYSSISQDNEGELNIVEFSHISHDYRKINRAQFPKLPIKWSRQLSDYIIHNVRGKSLQELNFEFIGDFSLKCELTRFKEVLLWYEENIPKKFQQPEEIFDNCIREGPAYADYLADTLKYSLRKTLGYGLEEALRDYPIMEGTIDYIFDPKCLVEWDSTDPEDYKLLFSEPRIVDEYLIDKVLAYLPIKELVEPDIIDYLKLYRKSKVFDSKKLETITTFKDTIKNPKGNTPHSLRFKRSVAHKYADEKRDILICDHDTLRIILKVAFYLQQLIKGCKEYKHNRTKVDFALRRHKGKYIYLMTDLKKSGLTISRYLVRQTLLKLYTYYGIEEFKILYDGFDSMLLYVNNEWKLTTEGKGLGLLDELVSLLMITLFRYCKEMGDLPDNVKGWFFNDDQLLMVPKETEEPRRLLKNWNDIISSFGFVVHESKPWISMTAQFCEVYSPNRQFITEKALRQYHIMVSNINLPIFEAKTNFANNFGKWWGLKPKDFNRSFDFVSSWFGYEFTDQERFYPVQFGGWTYRKCPDNKKLDYCLVDAFENWDTIDKRYINLLTKVKDIKIITKWWKSSFNKFQKLVPNLVDDDCMYSLKSRYELLKQSISLPTKFEYKYKYAYYTAVLKARQDAFFSKQTSRIELIKFVKNKSWNNFAIPTEICYGGIIDDSIKDFNWVEQEFSYTDDVQRLYNTYIQQYGVRPPREGDITSLFRVLFHADRIIDRGPKLVFSPMLSRLAYKLAKFGNNIEVLYQDLNIRFYKKYKQNVVDIDVKELINPLPSIEINLTESFIYLCYQGAIWKIDTENIPDGSELRHWMITPEELRKEVIQKQLTSFLGEFCEPLVLTSILNEVKKFNLKMIEQPFLDLLPPREVKDPPKVEQPSEVDMNYFRLQMLACFSQMMPTTGLVVSTYEAQQRIDLNSEIPELEDEACGNLFGDEDDY